MLHIPPLLLLLLLVQTLLPLLLVLADRAASAAGTKEACRSTVPEGMYAEEEVWTLEHWLPFLLWVGRWEWHIAEAPEVSVAWFRSSLFITHENLTLGTTSPT